MLALLHPAVSALALLQATQLNLFERFLTQAVSGIDSTSITSGMQNIAYVVLLVGFLWQVYQSALHGGDVRGLGTNLIKYVVTAVIVMNYHAVFTAINQGFVNAGNWINSASGATNLLDNWANDLKTQYNQQGFQNLWGLVTGATAGVLDGVLIIVAYILYPLVIAIFGFFYILYGSILYIFGPIVIALMPLGATNRLAKSYVENVFIWNAWPVLYGGFGALLSAVQMGQISQMLNQNNFLGGLGNLEGSILIGLTSIIYSLAIAVIPFIAKRIVSGEVGATAGTLAGAAVTALTAGIAAGEGIAAGVSASSATAGTAAQGSTSGSLASSSATAASGSNQPAPAQRSVAAVQQPMTSTRGSSSASTQGDHIAENIRESFTGAMGSRKPPQSGEAGNLGQPVVNGEQSAVSGISSATSSKESSQGRNGGGKRGPSAALMRPHGLATWGAYHAARLATQGVIRGAGAARGIATGVVSEVADPVGTAGKIGAAAGRVVGAVMNASEVTATAAAKAASGVVNPTATVGAGVQAIANAARGAAARASFTIRQSTHAAGTGFSDAYENTRPEKTSTDTEPT